MNKASLNAGRGVLMFRWMDELRGDLLYVVRILFKSPGFTAIAITSLALAIGANTAIFSYANQLLFVRLGVPHAGELRTFRLTGDDHIALRATWAGEHNGSYMGDDGRFHLGVFPYPAYQQLRRENHSVQDIFAFTQLREFPITGGGTPEVGKVELVSGNFYTEMRVKPQLGRPIEPSDDGVPGTGDVAVISDSFWHRSFGGSPDVLGKTVRVSGAPITIVGVNPPDFTGPNGMETTSPDIFVPLSLTPTVIASGDAPSPLTMPNNFWIQLMARAKPGVSIEQAETTLDVAFNAAFRGTAAVNKGETVPKLSLEDGSRGVTEGMRNLMKPLYVVGGLAGLVLLLACANIANLMLARASFRQREMSVRMALGAGRGRILRQVLTESLLLSSMGGLAGLILGYLSRNMIPSLLHKGWDSGSEMQVECDWRIFGFTCALTLLTSMFFSIAPAWRATHSEIETALKEGTRTATRKRNAWSGKAIVCFQVALSTLLVMSAVFFLRTLVNLRSVDPGFGTQNLLLVDINPPRTRYPMSKIGGLHARIEEAFAALPGVQDVSHIDEALGADFHWTSQFQLEGSVRDLDSDPKKTGHEGQFATISYVGPHFFSTMSIPILKGRGFTAQDTENSIPVSIVNQALVRKFFPNRNPIGKRFFRGVGDKTTRLVEIIGVCADTRYGDMRQPTPPVHFDLDSQSAAMGPVTYIISSPLAAASLIPSLERALQKIDPDLPLNNVRTQQQQIVASMRQERMFASLTSGFGLLALTLACVGIYGVTAYTVSQRTNEIGIRLALGAAREQIQAMVLRETGILAFCGILSGLFVTLALISLVKSMLYGLAPDDPITVGGSILLLLSLALAAGWAPARQASRLDPVESLRHD
jgi:predicted permease